MKIKFKFIWFYVILHFLFFTACGKLPHATRTIRLNIPVQRKNSKNDLLKLDDNQRIAPIHVYLSFFDNGNNPLNISPYIYGGDDDMNVTTNAISVSVTVPLSLKILHIRGHFFGKKIDLNNACSRSGLGDDNEFYFGEFTEKNQLEVNLTQENKDGTIPVTLVPISKFAFKMKNSDDSAFIPNYTEVPSFYDGDGTLYTKFVSSNNSPVLTTFYFYDLESGTRLKDPCSHNYYSGRIDSMGHLVTNFPMPLKDDVTGFFKVAADQFTLNANDCEMQSSDNPSFNICTNKELNDLHNKNATAPILYELKKTSETKKYDCSILNNLNNLNNPDGIPKNISLLNAKELPIFWELTAGSSNISSLSGEDSFLTADEIHTTSVTTICDRISDNFNPRFPDILSSTYNAQIYLQPGDVPTSAFVPYKTSVATGNLVLVNPNIFSFLKNSAEIENSTETINGVSLVAKQDLRIKCAAFKSEETSPSSVTNFDEELQKILGAVTSANFITSPYTSFTSVVSESGWGDCTKVATQGGVDGIAQYKSNYDPNLNDMYINFYYEDSEGYVIYNNNYTQASYDTILGTQRLSPFQPSSLHPLPIVFKNPN